MEQVTSVLGATMAAGVTVPGDTIVRKWLSIFRVLFQENKLEQK